MCVTITNKTGHEFERCMEGAGGKKGKGEMM